MLFSLNYQVVLFEVLAQFAAADPV